MGNPKSGFVTSRPILKPFQNMSGGIPQGITQYQLFLHACKYNATSDWITSYICNSIAFDYIVGRSTVLRSWATLAVGEVFNIFSVFLKEKCYECISMGEDCIQNFH